MKKLIIKTVYFFKKEHLMKYLIQFILFFAILVVFFFFSTDDVASNMLGTIIGFLFSTVILYFGKVMASHFEDVLKISYDTEMLLKTYKGAPEYRKTLELNGTKNTFAYADSLVNRGYTFVVEDDGEKFFELDDFILENYSLIFSAHSNSAKFNDTTIRLDDFKLEGDVCTLYLSRSTVFNHLITNRAIDFILFDDVTLRSIYEYGPVLSPYSKSQMSNHIGINGLVFLKDGYLLVPQRNASATISKKRITSSIAVKLDFPNSGQREITREHLFRGTILDNLTNRLNLPSECVDHERVEIDFLGFGQNVYEGGKPQFYFAIRLLDIDSKSYFSLANENASQGVRKLDIDSCIHVADYSTFRFKKEKLVFDTVLPTGKKKTVAAEYEMSYLNNLWHYEKDKDTLEK